MAITGVSNHDLWAAGSTFELGAEPQLTLVEHWNGSRWTLVPSPDVPLPCGNSGSTDCRNDILFGAAALPTGKLYFPGHFQGLDPNNKTSEAAGVLQKR